MKRTGSSDRKGRSKAKSGARKRVRFIKATDVVDPDDIEMLRKFTTDQGKILPARFTGANAKQQRQIKRAIRRARDMGLLR